MSVCIHSFSHIIFKLCSFNFMNLIKMPSFDPLQWKPRDVGTMIIVFVVVLVLCYYIIFQPLLALRRINRASTSRNQVQTRLLDESITDDPSLQPQSRGLEFSVVHSLPMHQIKKNEGERRPINTDCAICLGEFEEGEWLKHLPNCSHGFHVTCIDT